MSVDEILREVPRLSQDDLRRLARALCEAIEGCEDFADVLAALEETESPIPISEMRKKYDL